MSSSGFFSFRSLFKNILIKEQSREFTSQRGRDTVQKTFIFLASIALGFVVNGQIYAASSGSGAAFGLDVNAKPLLLPAITLVQQGAVSGSATAPANFDKNQSLLNIGITAAVLEVATGALTTRTFSVLENNKVESTSQVDGLAVKVTTLLALNVDTLKATATASCVNGVVTLSGNTTLANITGNILGLTANPAPNTTLSLLGVATIKVNTQTTTATSINVTALELDVDVLGIKASVKIGEASATMADCTPTVKINPIANITNATNQASYVIDGTCSAGSGDITVSLPAAMPNPATTVCSSTGTWNVVLDTNAVSQGSFTVTASQTASGATSTASATATKSTQDVTPPVAPTCIAAPNPAASTVTVTITCSGVETDATLVIPGAICTPTPATATNQVICTGQASSIGDNPTATTVDLAGNATPVTVGLTVVTTPNGPDAPVCSANPAKGDASTTVTITCTNIANGNTVTIPQTTCTPSPSTGGNVLCVGTPTSSNPIATVTDSQNKTATAPVPYTFETTSSGGPSAPVCSANPAKGDASTTVTITCTNIANGNTVTIPQTTCTPSPSTGGNVLCVGTPTSSNPIATVTDSQNKTATAPVPYTFETTSSGGPSVPVCSADPAKGDASTTVTITCTNIANGNTVTIPQTTCTPSPSTGGNVLCVGTPTSSNPIATVTDSQNKTATAPVPYTFETTGPNIVVSIVPSTTTVESGEPYTYTITVTNNGTAPTSGPVIVQNQLPDSVAATSVSGDGSCSNLNQAGALLNCSTAGIIPAGGSAIIVVNVIANSPGSIISYVASEPTGTGNPKSPAGPNCDPATTSCASSTAVTVNSSMDARLQLTKSVPAIAAAAGVPFEYHITISNVGSVPTIGNAIFQDQLPSSVMATAVDGANCTNLNSPGALLTCTIPQSIAANRSVNITITTVALVATTVVNYIAADPTGIGNPKTPPGPGCLSVNTICAQSPEVAIRKLLPSANGLYPVACTNVAHDKSRIATGTTINDHWYGKRTQTGANYVTDLLAPHEAVLSFKVDIPTQKAIYGEQAGKSLDYAAIACYPTTDDNNEKDYSLPKGGVVPRMQTGSIPLIRSNNPENENGKWPLIVFSHAANSAPLNPDPIATIARLAAEGYIVLAIVLADSRFTDVDMSQYDATKSLNSKQYTEVVATKAIRKQGLKQGLSSLLDNKKYVDMIDTDRIVGFGTLQGASTLLGTQGAENVINQDGTVMNTTYDDRYRAHISYSPVIEHEEFGEDNQKTKRVRVPHLAIIGDIDDETTVTQAVKALSGAYYVTQIKGMTRPYRAQDAFDLYKWSFAFLTAQLSKNQLDRIAFSAIKSMPGGEIDTLKSYRMLNWGPLDELEVVEYRLKQDGKYFMTGSSLEKSMLDTLPDMWERTGKRFATFRPDSPVGKPMKRFWAKNDSQNLNTHFYSTSTLDWMLMSNQSWAKDEGVVMRAPDPLSIFEKSSQTTTLECPKGMIGINRHFSSARINHSYTVDRPTISSDEADKGVKEGTVFCGLAYGDD